MLLLFIMVLIFQDGLKAIWRAIALLCSFYLLLLVFFLLLVLLLLLLLQLHLHLHLLRPHLYFHQHYHPHLLILTTRIELTLALFGNYVGGTFLTLKVHFLNDIQILRNCLSFGILFTKKTDKVKKLQIGINRIHFYNMVALLFGN